MPNSAIADAATTTEAIAAFTSSRFRVGDTPVFGYSGLGMFAEEVVVPADGAVKIAGDVPFEIAALVACGVMTGSEP